ncbi:adhesion G protein-coupled receptor G3 isoform X2 [Marmota marmota marmota]|uniref:adhesion G protein-coupled receptor G3 isoform X2 n=1 Tax=Marmota marmota marmota TaxID=9994 RepID=UPI0020928153|nr:adhesion G protein-coupled receptor G3 isoform X2 [Marmota marmota marmota]
MATPGGVGTLLLLLLASGEGAGPEEPRNFCLGLDIQDQYDPFYLNRTGECFARCLQLGNVSCNPEKLERYWLHYEFYLVEKNLEDRVDMPFVKALVQNFSTDTSEDLLFSLKPSQIPRQVMMGEDKPPDRVRLPRSFFASLPGSRSAVRLAISVLDIGAGDLFKGPQLRLEDGSSVLNNHMVGLSVGRTPVTRLPEPLEITFSHQRQPPNATLTCVFWDVNKGPAGDWDSKGCSTELGAEGTVCHCDHLTFFALLLRPVLDRATVQVLTHISQAGCGVSMIFLAFTIVLYLTLRFSLQRFKSEDAPKIHVALSSSLFLLNLAFLVSVGSGSAGSRAACWIRGAIFHYFLLCTFTWMGLEAFHLYLLVIKVFNTYFGHYYLKLSLVGWGLPALMVIGTGSANSYGLYTIRDQENRTSLELCWFQKEPALYATVHGYFLITFLFGAVVLALVAWKIFTLSSVTAGKEQGQSWKAVLTILGLSSLVSSSSAGLPSSTSRVRSPCLLPRGALPGWTRPPLCPMSRWPRPCAQTHLPSAVCPQQLLRMQGPRLLPLYGAAEEETGWILWPQRSHPDMSTDPRVPGCRCARDLGLQS